MKKYLWIFGWTVALFHSCGLIKDQAGAVATGNTGKIAGTILYSNVGLAKQSMLPQGYSVDVYLAKEDSVYTGVDMVTADESGAFHFDSLSEGKYRIIAVGEDLAQDTLSGLNVEPGHTLSVTMKLQAFDPLKDTVKAGFSKIEYTVSPISMDSVFLPVIFRDFQASHPDFEHYDSRAKEISASPIEGYATFTSSCNSSANITTILDDDRVCADGVPCTQTGAIQAFYGEYRLVDGYQIKGLRNQIITETSVPVCSGGVLSCYLWEEPVYKTTGMVLPELASMSDQDPWNWVPSQASERCHNGHIAQWFADVQGVNMRLETIFALRRIPSTQHFVYDATDLPGGVFHPLDEAPESMTLGNNNLDIWCPPYGALPMTGTNTCSPFQPYQCQGGAGESGANHQALCQELLDHGGPKSSAAVDSALAAYPEFQNLRHNDLFTLSSYIEYAYAPTDTLKFYGVGDFWVFVDGRMVLDYGGMNQPGEARVVFSELANLLGWSELSRHKLHLFYANRQIGDHPFRLDLRMSYQVSVDTIPLTVTQ